MKDLFGKGSLGYWLGGFAMILPLLTLVIAVPSVNYYSVLVVWVISQVSFLQSIKLLTQKYERRIKELKGD